MADLALRAAELAFDALVCCNDLATTDGLESAVIISLFTDRRASREQASDGNDLRGWWGDSFADGEGDADGSYLWLLNREKQTPETLERARGYARDSLQWLIDDAVASRIEVFAEYQATGFLGVQIGITDRTGQRRFGFEINQRGEPCRCVLPAPFDETFGDSQAVINTDSIPGT